MKSRTLLPLFCAALAAGALAADPTPTFNRDIAPILFQNCASCHRPGEVGPFPLLTYPDARKRARQIAKLTARRIMPPWKPVAGHGEFKYARVLTDAQIATLQAWHQADAPEGKAADLPPPPKFPEGWHAGPPDMILKVAKPYAVPAEGQDVSVQFVIPLDLKEDKYIRGVQIRPSDRTVAHHGVTMLDGSGKARELAAKNGGGYYLNFGDPGFVPRGFLPGYAPGMVTRIDDTADPENEVGITLGKGLDLVLQMHYHPTGKAAEDQPQIGLYFTDKKPKRAPNIIGLVNNDVDIPAGAKAHMRADSFKLPVDMLIRDIWSHMHMIGKKVHAWADLPDGSKKELLLIDDWDFNWQDTYVYEKPFVLPKGTVVHVEWTWDNTAENPRNPNTPPKRIVWGPNSTDEMTGMIIGGKTVNAGFDEGIMWLTTIGHYLDSERKSKEAQAERNQSATE